MFILFNLIFITIDFAKDPVCEDWTIPVGTYDETQEEQSAREDVSIQIYYTNTEIIYSK